MKHLMLAVLAIASVAVGVSDADAGLFRRCRQVRSCRIVRCQPVRHCQPIRTFISNHRVIRSCNQSSCTISPAPTVLGPAPVIEAAPVIAPTTTAPEVVPEAAPETVQEAPPAPTTAPEVAPTVDDN